jgi:2'-5' RNA ligase
MKKTDTGLYFLAVVPPSPLRNRIRELKLEFAKAYQTKASLKSPAHITLHMPFQWKFEKENVLFEALSKLVEGMSSFPIELNGFGAFKPRVIYLNVKAPEILHELQQSITRLMKREFNVFNANWRDFPFNPHLTIAFRDIRPAYFDKAWKENKDRLFKETFEADCLVLLKHNQKEWEIYKEFPFSHG